jgi:hypothetical protein
LRRPAVETEVKGVPLVLAAVLALTACGAGRETAPAGSTESSQPSSLPDFARVVCEAAGPPRVEAPVVKPQPDGVHIRFLNETGKDLSFSIEDPSEGGMGANAPQGTSSQVVDLHPGTVSIACYDAFSEDGSEVAKTPLEIVDEDGVWIPAKLTCAQQFSGYADYAPDARGDPDPREAARGGLDSYMQAGDVVEPAGYPEGETPLYRLVRAGELLAIVDLEDDGAGGWLPSTVTGCSSLER